MPEVRALLDQVQTQLRAEASGVKISERIRDGFEVAIVGPPNAGKSTLLNALAGRDAAITSSVAGTTRDVIEVRMELKGLPVTLLDTAGLREAGDEIEAQGIERARQRAAGADFSAILRDGVSDDLVMAPRDDDIVVIPKSDLGEGDFSAKTGDGLDELISKIAERLEKRAGGSGVAIRERHRIAIELSLIHI